MAAVACALLSYCHGKSASDLLCSYVCVEFSARLMQPGIPQQVSQFQDRLVLVTQGVNGTVPSRGADSGVRKTGMRSCT